MGFPETFFLGNLLNLITIHAPLLFVFIPLESVAAMKVFDGTSY